MAYTPKNPNWQATMANSSPVVLASDQSAVPISNAWLTEVAAAINGSSQMDVNIAANWIGLATSAKQDTIIWHVDGIETALTAANASLDAIEASTSAIDTDTTTIIWHLDWVEWLLTTIDWDTGALAGLILATQADDVVNTSDGLQVTNFNMVYDGATWDRLRGSAADGMLVNLWTNNDVVVSATDLDIRNLVNTDVVTAELSATDNAVLDAIAANVAAIDTDSTTIIWHLDWVETTLTAIDGRVDWLETSNSAIQTAVELIDNAAVVLGTATYTEATSTGLGIWVVRRDANTSLANTTNERTALQVNALGALKVGADVAVPVNVQIGNATLSAWVIDETGASAVDALAVGWGTAHDAVDSWNPIKQWYKAYAFDGTAAQTAVAEADRVNAISDLQGIQYVQISHPAFFHVSADYASAQTNVSVKAAPWAGSIFITDIQLSNGAVAWNVTLLDWSWGTVLWEAYPAINWGAVLNLRNPIKLTATTALCLTSTSCTTHSIFIAWFIA